MITHPAKIFLPITVAAFAAAVIYNNLTADGAGTALFVAIALGAFSAAMSITTSRENDVAPVVAADAGPPEFEPARPVRLVGGPGWPAVAGLGVGMTMLAFIAGPVFAIPALVVAVIAAAGWLGSIATDRTGRAPDLMPIGIPILGLVAIGSLMFLMSRMLLAVSEQASTFLALAVAVVILGAASFVALKPALKPRTLMAGLIVASLVFTAGGLVSAAVGPREIEVHHGGVEPVEVAAKDIQFLRTEIALPANAEGQIDFKNEDNVPHNIAVFANEQFTGRAIFQGAVVTKQSVLYKFPTPGPGTYFFRCDIHPAMVGKITVV